MSDDSFFIIIEHTYTDIEESLARLWQEVKTLDQDSLVEEVSDLEIFLSGDSLHNYQKIIKKYATGSELKKSEIEFLRNLYLTHYSEYGITVDEKEDDNENL